nr:hypothetical protein Itr_chr03CG16630 [Ipomoea trifida]
METPTGSGWAGVGFEQDNGSKYLFSALVMKHDGMDVPSFMTMGHKNWLFGELFKLDGIPKSNNLSSLMVIRAQKSVSEGLVCIFFRNQPLLKCVTVIRK